jgi:hypothetical protein
MTASGNLPLRVTERGRCQRGPTTQGVDAYYICGVTHFRPLGVVVVTRGGRRVTR